MLNIGIKIFKAAIIIYSFRIQIIRNQYIIDL